MWLSRKPITTLDLGDVSEVFELNHQSKATTVVNIGGARSGKSYSICQLFVEFLFTGENRNMLITRKTLPALRMTTYGVFINLLKSYNLYDVRKHNKTERTYTFKSNKITFTSIDDHNKMKSSEWNKVFFEEGDEFTYDDYMSIKLRMSAPHAPGDPNQIFIALNPSDQNDFINQRLMGLPDVDIIRSTYLQNKPFLPPAYIEEIEKLKDTDPEYWTIYGLGEYSRSRKRIYENWEEVPIIPEAGGEDFYGLDFGFNNPTALTRIKVVEGIPYVQQRIYKSGMLTGDLIKELGKLIPSKKSFIYADPEDKRAVEEIYAAGFNIIPAVKEVRNGIDFVKRYPIRYTQDSPEIKKESKKYSWKSDKAGNILDEPVKVDDHAMDSIRYGMYTHYLTFGDRAFGTAVRNIGKFTKKAHERREKRRYDEYADY